MNNLIKKTIQINIEHAENILKVSNTSEPRWHYAKGRLDVLKELQDFIIKFKAKGD